MTNMVIVNHVNDEEIVCLKRLFQAELTNYQDVDIIQTYPTSCVVCGFAGDPEALNYKGVCFWCHLEDYYTSQTDHHESRTNDN